MTDQNTQTTETTQTGTTIETGPFRKAVEAAQADLARVEALETATAEELTTAEAALEAAMAALLKSDEPKTYEVHLNDGGGDDSITAASLREAMDQWETWAQGGDYGDPSSTIWVHGAVEDEAGEFHPASVEIDPEEPSCEDDLEHDWRAEVGVVGGLAENTGVFGHGGGVVITAHCAHCGLYRETDTWAQDPETGEQGLRAIRYREADDASIDYTWAWLMEAIDEIPLPEGWSAARCGESFLLELTRDGAEDDDPETVLANPEELREVLRLKSWRSLIDE